MIEDLVLTYTHAGHEYKYLFGETIQQDKKSYPKVKHTRDEILEFKQKIQGLVKEFFYE